MSLATPQTAWYPACCEPDWIRSGEIGPRLETKSKDNASNFLPQEKNSMTTECNQRGNGPQAKKVHECFFLCVEGSCHRRPISDERDAHKYESKLPSKDKRDAHDDIYPSIHLRGCKHKTTQDKREKHRNIEKHPRRKAPAWVPCHQLSLITNTTDLHVEYKQRDPYENRTRYIILSRRKLPEAHQQ